MTSLNYLGSVVDLCQFWEVSKEVQDGLAAFCLLRKKLTCTPGFSIIPECFVLPASWQELAQGKGVSCSSSPSKGFFASG